jgi:hypothetical protein
MRSIIDPAVEGSKRKITLQASNMKGSEFLDTVVAQAGLTYDFRENGIYILENLRAR